MEAAIAICARKKEFSLLSQSEGAAITQNSGSLMKPWDLKCFLTGVSSIDIIYYNILVLWYTVYICCSPPPWGGVEALLLLVYTTVSLHLQPCKLSIKLIFYNVHSIVQALSGGFNIADPVTLMLGFTDHSNRLNNAFTNRVCSLSSCKFTNLPITVIYQNRCIFSWSFSNTHRGSQFS